MPKRPSAIKFTPAPGSPAHKSKEERGVYNGVTYEEREALRRERRQTGMSNAAQRQINSRLEEVEQERKAEIEPARLEAKLAAAAGKLLREILKPQDQHRVVMSLTTRPKIIREDEVVLRLAADLIRALPGEYWNKALWYLGSRS